jgi:hypothetical protein
VRSEYIKGILEPTKLLTEVLSRSQGLNVIRRICDPHESWYIGTAVTAKTRPTYICPYDKNSRKAELIKGLQAGLGRDLYISPECTDLIGEIESCRWSDTHEERIVNASSYHLLDSSQYFADMVPKADPLTKTMTWAQRLMTTHAIAKEKAEKKAENAGRGLGRETRRLLRGKRSRW